MARARRAWLQDDVGKVHREHPVAPWMCLCGAPIDNALPDPPYLWTGRDEGVDCPECLREMANRAERALRRPPPKSWTFS